MTEKNTFFQDKTYEEMDWLNQAMEPYVYSQNDDIAKLPLKIEISTFDEVLSYIDDSYLELHKKAILNYFIKQNNLNIQLNDDKILNLYEFQFDSDLILDFDNKILSHPIVLVKKEQYFNDEFLKTVLKNSAAYLTINRSYYHRNAQITRMNIIMDVLEINSDSRKSRSVRRKSATIRYRLVDIIEADKWKIRNVDFMLEILKWIKDYINNGDRKALANFLKLHCMTIINDGISIYSMTKIDAVI